MTPCPGELCAGENGCGWRWDVFQELHTGNHIVLARFVVYQFFDCALAVVDGRRTIAGMQSGDRDGPLSRVYSGD